MRVTLPTPRSFPALVAAALLLSLAPLAACTPGAVPSGVPVEDDDDFGTVEVYAVDEDAALSPAAGSEAEEVWDLFLDVATPEFAGASMLSYRTGDAATSDTLAYVFRDEDDPTLWSLAANLAYAQDRDLLLSTLIHEYGHILSLDVAEVDPEVTGCATLELSEGCAADGSRILAFQGRFWDAYGDEAPTSEASDVDEAFADAHGEDFVSDYATTNVTEDFAETFMTFVLEDEPTGESPVADKLRFLWADAQLVQIRERIRAATGL